MIKENNKVTYCDKKENVSVIINKDTKKVIENDNEYTEVYNSIDGKYKMNMEIRCGMDNNNLFKILKCNITVSKSNSLNALSYINVLHEEEMFLMTNENQKMCIDKRFVTSFIDRGLKALNKQKSQLDYPIPSYRADNVANIIKMNTVQA